MLECSSKNTSRVKKKWGESTSRVKRNRGKIWSEKILVTRQMFSHFSPIFFFPDKISHFALLASGSTSSKGSRDGNPLTFWQYGNPLTILILSLIPKFLEPFKVTFAPNLAKKLNSSLFY